MKTNFKLSLIALAAAMTLSACSSGGGGGDDTTTDGTTTLPVSTATVSDPATSVPTASYTNGSDVQITFSDINAMRQAMGVGLLAQNTRLDTAAFNHNKYLIDNNKATDFAYLTSTQEGVLGAHYEDPALSGFTGKFVANRAQFANYTGTVSEDATFGSLSGRCGKDLLNTVYHLISFIGSWSEVGIGSTPGTSCIVVLGHDAANGKPKQLPTAGTVTMTPGDGETGVPHTFFNQTEAPTPAADIGSGTGVGKPVIVSLYSQGTETLDAAEVTVSNFTITQQGGGAPLAARILVAPGVTGSATLTSDSNLTPFGAGYIVLLPTSPLSANTTYNVTFSGTVKGAVKTKSISFTTGA